MKIQLVQVKPSRNCILVHFDFHVYNISGNSSLILFDWLVRHL